MYAEQVKYERDTLLTLILDGDEFGPEAFERAEGKITDWRGQSETVEILRSALAFWMCIAGFNGAQMPPDLRAWCNKTVKDDDRVAVQVTREALKGQL